MLNQNRTSLQSATRELVISCVVVCVISDYYPKTNKLYHKSSESRVSSKFSSYLQNCTTKHVSERDERNNASTLKCHLQGLLSDYLLYTCDVTTHKVTVISKQSRYTYLISLRTSIADFFFKMLRLNKDNSLSAFFSRFTRIYS